VAERRRDRAPQRTSAGERVGARRRRSSRDTAPGTPRTPEQTTLAKWQRRIAVAKKVREEWETEYQVELLERFFLGKQTHLGTDEMDDLWLNHFAATVQTQRPALLPTKLTFDVTAKPGQPAEDTLRVKSLAGVLDTIAGQDNHLMKSVRLAATQAFFRIGVLKVCYEPQMEPNPRAGEPLLNEVDAALLGQGSEGLLEPEETLTDEVYRWRWVNAKHMLLPDAGPDTTRWPWIGEEIEVTLEEAKADTRFPAEKRRAFKANGQPRDLGTSWRAHREEDRQNEDAQMFHYCECWDMLENRVYCWAEGQSFDGFLLDEPFPDGVEDRPYALLIPTPVVAPVPSPWPKPVCYDWLPIQQQYNLNRTQQIEGGKRSARKYFYDENTFPDGDEAEKALNSSNDLQGVKVLDTSRPPLTLTDPGQTPDVWRGTPLLLADWHTVTGSSGAQLSAPDANTATEAVISQQAGSLRDTELRTLVQEWLTEAGQFMLQLVQQTLTLDLWVQLRDMDDAVFREFVASPGFRAYLGLRFGPENVPMVLQMFQIVPGMAEQLKQRFGALKPLKVSRAELQMEANVTVVPSTARPLYRAQLLQLANILGPIAMMSPTFLEELLHSFELPQGDRIADEITSNLRQQAAMMAQMQQQKAGGRPMPGMPNAQNGANPVGTQNPLGAVSGGMV
jgi:hypothetical protein